MASITLISGETRTTTSPPLPTSLVETCAQKTGRIAYLILSIIIFPIGLARLLGYIFHQIALKNFVVPMCGSLPPQEKEHFDRTKGRLETEMGAKPISLVTPHGDQLKGHYIRGEKHPEKVALLVCPNNMRAPEFLASRSGRDSIISKLGISCCAIDYPGVGESGGSVSLENLPLTVYSSLHHLVKEEKFAPENIVVHGWSLGGSGAATGVALFEEENPEARVPIAHERSFEDLLGVVGKLGGSFARFTAWSCGLQIDSKSAFDKLRGPKLVIDHPQDEIMAGASLAEAIEKDPRYQKTDTRAPSVTVLQMQTPSPRPHLADFSEAESDAIAHKIAAMLKINFELPQGHQSPPLTHYTFIPL